MPRAENQASGGRRHSFWIVLGVAVSLAWLTVAIVFSTEVGETSADGAMGGTTAVTDISLVWSAELPIGIGGAFFAALATALYATKRQRMARRCGAISSLIFVAWMLVLAL